MFRAKGIRNGQGSMFFEGDVSCAIRLFRIVDSFHAFGAAILQRIRVVRIVNLICGYLIAGCFTMIISGSIARSNMRPTLRVDIEHVFIFIVWYFR